MNAGAATAFLPNFVWFPSLRGLPSSPVHPPRAPHVTGVRPARAGDVTALPPGSVAPAAPTTAARGPAAAGVAAPAGVPSPVVAARAAGRPPVTAAGPPAAAVTAAPAAPARRAPDPGRRPPRHHREPDDEHHRDHHQADAEDHGTALLPFPRSGPPWAPRAVPDRLRARGMPGRPNGQSTLEEHLRVNMKKRPLTCTDAQIRGRPKFTGPSVGRVPARRHVETRCRWHVGPARGCRASGGRTRAASMPDRHAPCTR